MQESEVKEAIKFLPLEIPAEAFGISGSLSINNFCQGIG